jgi:hypothetical protein
MPLKPSMYATRVGVCSVKQHTRRHANHARSVVAAHSNNTLYLYVHVRKEGASFAAHQRLILNSAQCRWDRQHKLRIRHAHNNRVHASSIETLDCCSYRDRNHRNWRLSLHALPSNEQNAHTEISLVASTVYCSPWCDVAPCETPHVTVNNHNSCSTPPKPTTTQRCDTRPGAAIKTC